jgi:DNA-binding CsgD family transcriptional regulator
VGAGTEVSTDRQDAELGAEQLVERATRLIAAVRDALDAPVRRPDRDLLDLEAARTAVVAAEEAARRHLSAQASSAAPPARRLPELIIEAMGLRIAIGEARIRRQTLTAGELHRALGRLRAGHTVNELLEQIPVELGGLGFSRSLLCRLRGQDWSAATAFAHADVTLADALVRVGTRVPGRLGREEPETEMVRRRLPIVVRDAQHRPRTHRELIKLSDTRDYVAAPIVAHGSVIALVHVDRHSQSDVVDTFDRDLLGLFAEGVGLAFERVRAQEGFGRLRRQFERQLDDVQDCMSGVGGWTDPDDVRVPRTWARPENERVGSVSGAFVSDGPLVELTRRELQVLRHLACGGSNQDIATRLGVSVGTVKTHVKHLLRKLGVANRAEATARFHQLARVGG